VDDVELRAAISRSVNSDTKSYRYVLPTQLTAKLADSARDARSLQAGSGLAGAFDARTFAHEVVVAFDKANNIVLGGAPAPYLNNPLRVPSVTAATSKAQRDKTGWQDLVNVLDQVQAKGDPAFTETVLEQTLIEVHRRLADVRVDYPAPLRVSLLRTMKVLDEFLSESSGGDRPQAVATALFEIIGERFGRWDQVRRAQINEADLAKGRVADLECLKGDAIVMAVEVKDRELRAADVDEKVASARAQGVREVLFVAQQGVDKKEREDIFDRIEREFASGANVYITSIVAQVAETLALLGEDVRVELLKRVSQQLEESRADIRHRRRWAELLRAL
jgi:hypothetical protein